MLFFYSPLLIQIYWITCYVGSLTSGSDHSSIVSYTEKNTNSKISVQGAMLVGTNGTTTLRNIPTIIRGKDRRERISLF
jgi:hypothetical protein